MRIRVKKSNHGYDRMAKLILIIGGARSGKSRFAQQLAGRLGGDNVDFIATAEAGDSEMASRIQVHQRTRPAAWVTYECPIMLCRLLPSCLSETG